VVDQLSAEFPKLKTFATLSPIPGLRAWITQRLERETPDFALASGERKAFGKVLGPVEGTLANGPGRDVAMVKHALATTGWYQNAGLRAALEKPLSRLTAEYLLTAKRPDGRALDPVAQFHLSNGARVERLNPLADTSKRGLEQSYGMMVNYAYRLAEIEENLEAYTGEGKIAAASAVAGLV
jgi:malonyl-CoA decarboxylase